MSIRVLARAPSNIAVIKYMGKEDPSLNLPANPSLSLTLSRLTSWTEIEWHGPGEFALDWRGASEVGGTAGLRPVDLVSRPEIEKTTRHILRIANALAPDVQPGFWKVRSGNRFPSGAGIASSASGFAALTLAVATALQRFTGVQASIEQLTALSRQGSGSSCRSFEGPWVEWQGTQVRRLSGDPGLSLCDLVLVVDERSKQVGSSEAHQRVLSSPLWAGRTDRASSRHAAICKILGSAGRPSGLERHWREFSALCFEEAMDMHELFHSANPAFSYWTDGTRSVLSWLKSRPELPVAVTLDAGPNVHLLVPAHEAASLRKQVEKSFPGLPLLEDEQGTGAEVLE
ncbi:MAG: diphosphomevalonate/mevalonate 3,5-bisphosphate decarboxylase family protein [Oligoflexia bacterium]